MQKRVHIAGQRRLPLEEPAYKLGPGLASGTWYLVHSLIHKDGLWLLHCSYKAIDIEHLHSFWECEIWVDAGRGCWCDQPPVKSLKCWVQMGFPKQKHGTLFTVAKGAHCVPSPDGDIVTKPVHECLQIPPCAFSPCWSYCVSFCSNKL